MLGFVRWNLVPLPADAFEPDVHEEPAEAGSSTSMP